MNRSREHHHRSLPACLVHVRPEQVINRSVRYKNRYVHRRDSLSLANITLDEKEKLAKIGEGEEAIREQFIPFHSNTAKIDYNNKENIGEGMMRATFIVSPTPRVTRDP